MRRNHLRFEQFYDFGLTAWCDGIRGAINTFSVTKQALLVVKEFEILIKVVED